MELCYNDSSNSWEFRYVPSLLLAEDSSSTTTQFKRKSSAPTPVVTPNSSPKKNLYTSQPSRSSSSLSLVPKQLVTPNGSETSSIVGNANSIFRLPKPQVKLLKKTASVRQLYNSVLYAIKTIASARDDNTAPELTKNFFESILRDSEENPKLQVTKVKVTDSPEFGRNFCSQVHAVEVTAKFKDSEDTKKIKTYHLVVKSQPQNEDARLYLHPSHAFETEVQMYGLVFHDMGNYVRRATSLCYSCKDSDVIDVQRCFYTKWDGEDNNKEDLIILENLYPQGFNFAVNQDDGLDRVHSELVIRELAKFHAISYCMKEGKNESILSKYNCFLEDSLYRKETLGFTKRTIMPVMASLAELLRNTPKYKEYTDWFIDLAKNFHAIQMEMVAPVNSFAVICHGDLWLSNILFKYNEFNNQPVEVKFIDFQSARFSSLATDLLIFFFTSVKRELRRQMLGELISLYYTTFLISVRSLNILEDIFSLEELLVEIENHIFYGFLEGIWYLDIIHNGQVPIHNKLLNELSRDDEEESTDSDFDVLPKIQVNDTEDETEDQKKYKEDFFELLDEVLFLLGKSKASFDDVDRRSLRDSNLFFSTPNSFTKQTEDKEINVSI